MEKEVDDLSALPRANLWEPQKGTLCLLLLYLRLSKWLTRRSKYVEETKHVPFQIVVWCLCQTQMVTKFLSSSLLLTLMRLCLHSTSVLKWTSRTELWRSVYFFPWQQKASLTIFLLSSLCLHNTSITPMWQGRACWEEGGWGCLGYCLDHWGVVQIWFSEKKKEEERCTWDMTNELCSLLVLFACEKVNMAHSVIWVGQKMLIFQIGKTTLSDSYTLLFATGISV